MNGCNIAWHNAIVERRFCNVRILDDYGKDIKLTVGNGEKEK